MADREMIPRSPIFDPRELQHAHCDIEVFLGSPIFNGLLILSVVIFISIPDNTNSSAVAIPLHGSQAAPLIPFGGLTKESQLC